MRGVTVKIHYPGFYSASLRVSLLLILTLACCGVVWADPLSELPSHWQEKLKSVPEADISGAEPVVQQTLTSARKQTAELLADATAEAGTLAREFGNLGNLYQVYNIHALAESCYANAQTLQPDSFRWHYYSAYLGLSDGRVRQGIERLERAAALDPGYPPLQLRLGKAWFDLNELDKSRRVLERAAEKRGLRAAALYYLGQIELLQRNYPKAIEWFKEALTIDPQASQIHYPLARAYRAAGDAQRAREHLALRGKQMPHIEDPLVLELDALQRGARPFYGRAMQAIKGGDYQAAVDAFRLGLEKDPDNINARISLARTLYLAGEQAQARQALEQITRDVPDNTLAAFLLAVQLEASGESDRAVALYQKVVSIDPQHAGAHYFLANRLMLERQFRQALSHYRATLAAEPENPPARLYHLVAMQRGGEPEQVLREEMEREFRQHHEEPMLKYAHARLLAASQDQRVRNPARAMELGMELVDSYPIPPHLEVLALAYAASGDFGQAINLQNQLIEGAYWMGDEPYRVRLQATLEGFESGKLPASFWPEDDLILTPQPVNAALVIKEYPASLPY
jgi:tetratricopeptide (TPR) repeat protein